VLVAFAAIVTALVVGLMSPLAVPASASPFATARNAVGAFSNAGGQRVGPHERTLAGDSRQRAPGYDQIVSASCVAPETAGAEIPQSARAVLNQVDESGGPLSGYKGGSTFANDGRAGGQVLPQTTPGGDPITYQEWDVNPYQKGVNRGAERLVTGSDGSAWYTNDHYSTFVQVRGSGG
jgi:guanyl-specific ribonuclease Sa